MLTTHFTIVKHEAVSGEIGFMLTKFQMPLKKSRMALLSLYIPRINFPTVVPNDSAMV